MMTPALLAVAATIALLYMLATALHNYISFPRLAPAEEQHIAAVGPPVSVLIPARNEAERIGPTLRSLLASPYPAFEIWVLDDASGDETAQLARRATAGDARVQIVSGAPLPQGWLGKNWACWQLAQLARHDLLLFTDADVHWTPEALGAVIQQMNETQAGLLTVWPTQHTVTWGERLLVPMMTFALLAYLPIRWAHDAGKPAAAAANGQCLLFRRSAYKASGGHRAVRASVIEDIHLAQRIKQHGLRLRMADGAGLVSCRMYHGLSDAFDGYTKNILAGHGNSPWLLLLSTLFHIGLFIGPWLWLLAGARLSSAAWPLWPLLLITLGLLVRALTAAAARQRVQDSLLLPISVLLLAAIALRALWARLRRNGPQWKGRRIYPAEGPPHGLSR